jgi:hypothetical protein
VGNPLARYRAAGLWSVKRRVFIDCDFAPNKISEWATTSDKEVTERTLKWLLLKKLTSYSMTLVTVVY